MQNKIIILLDIIIMAWCSLAMLRLLLQKGGLPFSHPAAIFLDKATEWAVKPIRKIVPAINGWDIAIVVTIALLLFSYEFIKYLIIFYTSEVGLLPINLVVFVFLLILIKIFTVFVYAFWFAQIILYLTKQYRRDVYLYRALDFVTGQLMYPFRYFAKYKLALIVFILASIWIFLIYETLIYELSRYLLNY